MIEKERFPEVENTIKHTESGVVYREHTFKRNDGETHIVKVFEDLSSNRLTEEGETYEEYKIRRTLVNRFMKAKKKGTLLWTPYPFGKGTKGLSMNDKNKEVIKAVMENYNKKQEEELKTEEV